MTALPAARRSFLIAALVLVSVGALMSREGDAERAAAPTPDTVAPVEANFADLKADPETLQPPPAAEWTTVTVKSGQTLSTIFDAQDLPTMDWVKVVQLGGDASRLKKLKTGDQLKLRKGPEGLQELSYALDEARTLQVSRTDTGFEAITLAAEIERRPTYAMGTIKTSVSEAALSAGLSASQIQSIADIFGYDIDFGQDIRVGDHFTVIYEDLYKNGQRLRGGDVLAAEFVNQGKPLRAVRYTDPQGNTGFYAPEGQSLRKSFIRTPLDVFRISSNFSTARFHPVLNKFRAHLGTDYAAPVGTPVKATGDGRVVFVGNKGGYGHCIIVRHGSSYETLYGHLSRFASGISYGSRVRQGQYIGYVGQSGLATGPHLHYEFRINGVHRDPRKVILPRASSLPRQNLDNFRAVSNPLLTQLDALNRSQVASAN